MLPSHKFREKVNEALVVVKRVLDNTRSPAFVGEVPHNYDDKFAIVEQMGASTFRCSGIALEHLGVTEEIWNKMQKWATKRTVTLRFEAESTCKFVKETTRQEKSTTEYVTVTNSTASASFVVHTITEYEWLLTCTYTLRAFSGADPNGGDSVLLQTNTGEIALITRDKTMPRKEILSTKPDDIEITYLIKSIGPNFGCNSPFKIARESRKHCRTPRRNAQVDTALNFFRSFFIWAKQVNSYFQTQVEQANQTGGGAVSNEVRAKVDFSSLFDTQELFVPILPLMDKNRGRGVGGTSNMPAVTAADGLNSSSDTSGVLLIESTDGPTINGGITTNALHAAHEVSLTTRFDKVAKLFVDSSTQKQTITTATEAKVIVVLAHIQQLIQMFENGIDAIETELHRLVVEAIGKVVTCKDIREFMIFHSRKIYTADAMPKPFCYDIRRLGYAPEGEVSMQTDNDNDAVWTSCHVNENPPMFNFALNAATDVKVEGRHVLHGYMRHTFSTEAPPAVELVARARQFSHFIVMVGSIVGTDRFEPKHAIIVKNKDLVKIPLKTEMMPTAKEFAEAVESLSPEQKAFAVAFREMQLASTLFGVLVLPVKPLLERLLNLPNGALAKEIRLTEELMELFIEYQVPSDMMTFSGSNDADTSTRVEAVRDYVEGLMDMINEMKETEVEKSIQTRAYNHYEVEEEEEVDVGGGDLFGGGTRIATRVVLKPAKPSTANRASNSTADVKPAGANAVVVDYTSVPRKLDSVFGLFDADAKLRPTKLMPSDEGWTRCRAKNLLDNATTTKLDKDALSTERNQAMDLLDALSRSGELTLFGSTLHVVVAVTHCFDKSVMDTLVRDNVNPIVYMERSSRMLNDVIHGKSMDEIQSNLEALEVSLPSYVKGAEYVQMVEHTETFMEEYEGNEGY